MMIASEKETADSLQMKYKISTSTSWSCKVISINVFTFLYFLFWLGEYICQIHSFSIPVKIAIVLNSCFTSLQTSEIHERHFSGIFSGVRLANAEKSRLSSPSASLLMIAIYL